MDAYPGDYIVHNLPLLLLSGLGEESHNVHEKEGTRSLLQEGGFRLRIDLPDVDNQHAKALREALLQGDASEIEWSAKSAVQSEKTSYFRIQSIGREFTLPPRKAPPPPHSPRLNATGGGTSPPPAMILHSVLSPLSPRSPLYADGIMTPLWVTKHQSRLPSSFVIFFTLSADVNTNTLLDNKIKTEISNIRSVFASANYKTKLAFVLIGDPALNNSDAEDRLASIRRAAAIDSKSLFFFPAESSSAVAEEFVRMLLQSLQNASMEYYRDLSKHARRKRNRSVIPQPTVLPTAGTSQLLSSQAWVVRYEFKLGVFAEFRQEMDAALRSYETAYESLCGAEVFESIPFWSPRFNEARLLSDTLAIRIIRCLLWNGQTTVAVKRWSDHRNRISGILDRRGPGTETYGWAAWQSIWAKTMADLIHRAQIHPKHDQAQDELTEKSILIHSEKTLTTSERFVPWESLHHEGYWLVLAQRCTLDRRTQALKMPEEDRASPGESPASMIASRAQLYDKYLTLEPYKEFPTKGLPGYDYKKDIIDKLDSAIKYFVNHNQIRMVQYLKIQKTLEMMRSSDWEQAILMLQDLWQDPILKAEGWWLILQEIGQKLWTCAVEQGDVTKILQMEWEITHPLLSTAIKQKIELPKGFRETSIDGTIPRTQTLQDRLTAVSTHVAFALAEGHVGQPIVLQLSLNHLNPAHADAICPIEVIITFEGKFSPIHLAHAEDESSGDKPPAAQIIDISLPEPTNDSPLERNVQEPLRANANLSVHPGCRKIFQIQSTPRGDGDITIATITQRFERDERETKITVSGDTVHADRWYEIRKGQPIGRRHGKGRSVATMTILPKPPRLQISIAELRKAYYTDEQIQFDINYVNLEDEVLNGSIEARLISPAESAAILSWQDDEEPSKATSESAIVTQAIPTKKLENLAAGDTYTNCVKISSTQHAVDHELEIIVTYTLPSGPYTTMRKQLTLDLPVIRPFEANFGFHSRCQADAWPSFFSAKAISSDNANPSGVKQRYLVSATICSFAVEAVVIESTRLLTTDIAGDVVCTISDATLFDSSRSIISDGVVLQSEQDQRFDFDVTLQKHTLGNHQPVVVDFLLEITWQRSGATSDTDKVHKTRLQVPRFLAPVSEPRVLLQLQPVENSVTPVYELTYTIENPSLHFLGFNITMESSEEFAFSGPKATTISLVPISRHDIRYQIMPLNAGGGGGTESNSGTNTVKDRTGISNGQWLMVHLVVVDAYFGQTLRPQPASEGVKLDKQGNVLVRVA